MKKEFFIKKRLKATSLVEVLVVLAVISLTIVFSVSLVAKARVVVKNNEIQDQANGLMIKALEIFKSPSDIFIPAEAGLTNTAASYSFSFDKNSSVVNPDVPAVEPNSGGTTLLYQQSDGPITICDANTNPVYRLDRFSFPFCEQILISPKQDVLVNQTYYEIIVNVVYELNNKQVQDSIKTYRYYGFKQN